MGATPPPWENGGLIELPIDTILNGVEIQIQGGCKKDSILAIHAKFQT